MFRARVRVSVGVKGRLSIAIVAACCALAGSAEASCVKRTFMQYLNEADQVFLGRAGKEEVKGGRSVQRFTVLHAIKGKLGPTFDRVLRAGVTPPNHRTFAPGELAIVFAQRGTVELCSGNFELEAHLPDLPLLLAGGEKNARLGPVEVPAVEAALVAALKGYVHGRRAIVVGYPPQAGKTATVHGARVLFQRRAPADEVTITRANVAGPVRLVSGTYGKEGLSFDVVLLRSAAQGNVVFEPLRVWVRERSQGSQRR